MYKFIVLALCFALFSSASWAAERVAVFTSEIQVESQAADARDEGFKQALAQVLFKVTGQNMDTSDPAWSSFFDRSDRHVLSFGYRDNPRFGLQVSELDSPADDASDRSATDELSLNDASLPFVEKPFLMTVEFSSEPLLRQIRDLDLSVWGALRPTIIAWVVEQSSGLRSLIGAATGDSSDLIERAARNNGLPLLMPIGDLQDQSSLNLSDVWGLFPEAVNEASQRYPHDGVLMARIGQRGGAFELAWTFRLGEQVLDGRIQAPSEAQAWGSVTAEIASALARRYAVVEQTDEDAQSLIVQLGNIATFVSYANAVDHLKSLSSVERVELKSLAGDQVHLTIALRGSLNSFEQQVELAGLLRPHLATGSLGLNERGIESGEAIDFMSQELNVLESSSEPSGVIRHYIWREGSES